MTKRFVHLHVHTEYSLLDGMSKISKLLSHVKENGMDSVALTDHGTMYGAIEFYKKCLNQGVKPIVGMEAYTTDVDHRERPQRGKFKNYHLLLLAKNKEGYKNLMKITSIAHLEGYYYRPRISREILAKYSKGLICTSACPAGELARRLTDGQYGEARKVAKWFLDVFGKDYYLEIQRHKYHEYIKTAVDSNIKNDLNKMTETEKTINQGVIKLSRQLGIPIVATNDAHYIKKEDASAQDALVCIATGKEVTDTKRLRFIDTPEYYVKSPQEMWQLFQDYPDSLENTVKIAEKCNVEIKLGQWFFPKIDLPEGKSASRHLVEEANKGLRSKFSKVTKELQDRLDYELQVILDKGYPEYFLIFQDMANWAMERGIPINTRGSAAGSLVSYSLGITTVDPVRYQLPFERFLNPFRPSAPDIDMDISDAKREEMIAYLTDKYGREKVAQICTFGRMLARASVRDVARVLGYAYAIGDNIAKLIPMGSQGFPMTIDRALKDSQDLDALYRSDKDAKRIIDLARQIEGNARHVSVHAAGVVISPTKMTDFSPVQLEPSGERVITQYEMHACEDIGLIKLDILGIRNLAILGRAVEIVKKTQGKEVNLSEIPLDDKKTFDMLSRGETMGTFQLSGSGMTRYLVELVPERIEDIMAMIALFRPGPMANIPEYIARKKGQKKVEYYHPKMKRFLEKSFGILVYQDDLLYTAMEIAGYDWRSVDKFRKAVGKKIPEEMAKQHVIFVDGCLKHSQMTKKEAEGLWKLFEPFQGYGFNKAHAASYGMVAYQTSYMKANFPVEFMCALLTAESNDTDKVSAAINEAKRMGIKVLRPDINESEVGFEIVDDPDSLEGKAIRFGLSAIKNVGKAAIEAILSERGENGFQSFADFLSRVDNRKVNKKVLESLIKVGALSQFGTRASLLTSLETVRSRVAKPKHSQNQQELFSQEEINTSMKSQNINLDLFAEEFSDEELQSLERQLLGFALSAKPIGEVLAPLKPAATHRIEDVLGNSQSSRGIKLAVLVKDVRIVVTKRTGLEMAFLNVEDETGSMGIVVFPKMFSKTRGHLIDNQPLLISGKVDQREDSVSLIADEIDTADSLIKNKSRLYIGIPKGVRAAHLKKLKKLLLSHPGEQRVSLIFRENGERTVDLEIGISWSESLAKQINGVLQVDFKKVN